MIALCDRFVVWPDQYPLDPGRTKFDTEDCFSALNIFFIVCHRFLLFLIAVLPAVVSGRENMLNLSVISIFTVFSVKMFVADTIRCRFYFWIDQFGFGCHFCNFF